MTMKNPPFEDAFPIEHGDFPITFYIFLEGLGLKNNLYEPSQTPRSSILDGIPCLRLQPAVLANKRQQHELREESGEN